MPTGTFKRVIMKGARQDRALFLSVIDNIETRHGPIGGDGHTIKRVRTTSGPVFVRITKRSVSIQREPFGFDTETRKEGGSAA